MSKSYLNIASLPRGIRNNNPGNLVRTGDAWLGKVPHYASRDARFEQFTALKYGIRALMKDILNDVRKGKDTITKLITEFAPEFENKTGTYIDSVAAMTHTGANVAFSSLSKQQLIGLCKAIIFVENGSGYSGYITDADYEEAYAILGTPLASIAVAAETIQRTIGTGNALAYGMITIALGGAIILYGHVRGK